MNNILVLLFILMEQELEFDRSFEWTDEIYNPVQYMSQLEEDKQDIWKWLKQELYSNNDEYKYFFKIVII